MSDVSLKATVTYAPRGDVGRFIEVRLKPGIVASVSAAQDLIVSEAQNLCPVRTGKLKASIKKLEPEFPGKTVVGAVVAEAEYAGYVEYGTGIRGSQSAGAGPYPYNPSWPGMEARPFLRPSLDTTREDVRGIFGSNLAIALKV
jgi:HK97 gp10 family phage protein